MLGAMGLQPTVIDTKGFQSLLNLVDCTAHDSFELYYGLFMYNQVGAEGLRGSTMPFSCCPPLCLCGLWACLA